MSYNDTSMPNGTLTTVVSPGQIKMVIWDLDETFWKGTLSEEGIEPIAANLNLVQRLARSGIVSSICSKNEHEAVKSELERLEVWDFFVFPVIQWAPKGPVIRQLIERAHLRPENVLFVDDNHGNLQDAAFHCPGLMCANSPQLLAEAFADGVFSETTDPLLSRLRHYQLLEKKTESQETLSLSNEEFLRESQIEVEIRYDVENYMDRIIELLNRSNQLNFTKNRIETEADRATLTEQLTAFGFKAGVVNVKDRYGDYGVVGFFLTLSTLRTYHVKHFVFSCRILDMGVEQYVYEYLNEPEITIRHPVVNGIKPFRHVDWISAGGVSRELKTLKEKRLVLIGGCDLLQVSTYCSCESSEFTNRASGELMVRLDDPEFFLGSPEKIEASRIRKEIPTFSAQEMLHLERQLAEADGVILSLYEVLRETYFRGKDGLVVRFHPESLNEILKSERGRWFVRNFWFVELSLQELLDKVTLCILSVLRRTQATAPVIILTEMENTHREPQRKARYNAHIRQLSRNESRVRCVDINEFVKPEWLIDGWHLTRLGYFEMSKRVMDAIERSQ